MIKNNKNRNRKNKNAKIVFYLFVALIIIANIAAVATAASADFMDNVLQKIYGFEDRYDKNPKLWDFILFSTIFNIIAWLGLAKAFPDNKVAAYILATVLGLVLGIAAVKANLSAQFFIPFVQNAFFFVVMIVIMFVFVKFEMNKFWAFILSLVITFVLFNVFGLFGGDFNFGGLFKSSASYDTYEQINSRLIALGNNHHVAFEPSDGIVEKAKKLREAMQREQGILEEQLRKNPDDKTARSRLDQVIAHINEVNELERKGVLLEQEEEKKLAERVVKEYYKFRENLTEIQNMKLDSPAEAKAKFVDLKKLNDTIEEEEEKVRGTPKASSDPTTPAGTPPTSPVSVTPAHGATPSGTGAPATPSGTTAPPTR